VDYPDTKYTAQDRANMAPEYNPNTQTFDDEGDDAAAFRQEEDDASATAGGEGPCGSGPIVECGDRWVGGRNKGKAICVRFKNMMVTTAIVCQLKNMFDAAARDGVTLQINSGFRTQAEQLALRARNCRRGRCKPATAPAGTSNHQNGIAVDLATKTNPAAYTWLRNKAHSFGFIRAVPSETWHWEYHPGRDCKAIVRRNKDGSSYTCQNS
jgi:hypothetical protein